VPDLTELLADLAGPDVPLDDERTHATVRARGRRRRIVGSTLVCLVAVTAIAMGVAVRPDDDLTVRVGSPSAATRDPRHVGESTTITVPGDWDPLPEGVALVGAGTPGSLAGYVYNADLGTIENPPVYGGQGQLVGYVVPNVGFVAKDVFEAQGFDPKAEEIRRYGEDAVAEREATAQDPTANE
jgi:hypothetical protein